MGFYLSKVKIFLDVSKLLSYKAIRITIGGIVAINFLFLLISTLRPANPSVNFYKFIYNNPQIKSIYAHMENPFSMLGLPLNFYRRSDVEVSVFNKIDEIEPLNNKYVFLRTGRDFLVWDKKKSCDLLYLTYPRFSINYNIGNWLSRSRVWSLFHCK